MAVGQSVLVGAWDLPALRAAEGGSEARAADAGRVHAALLRDVLVVHAQYCAAGMPLSSQPQVALLLRCSELRAGKLLNDALGLAELPEALAALEWGLLTVEQSSVVVAQLAVLSLPDRLRVWDRLLVRLRRDVEQGAVLPPARLADLLRGWVMEADQDAARERREQAERDRRVEYRRRDDGLVDLLLFGVRPELAQAALQRIRDESAPVGLWDERTADRRRLDAAVDLLLGRTGSACATGCGCLPGTPGVCGADVAVLVPLPTALGAGEVPAELVGHGPIDHGLLQDLLANAPRLRPVFVDEHGVPVAVGDKVLVPERGDPAWLRRALLQLSETTPDRLHPRHPHDHPPDDGLARDVGPPGEAPRPRADDDRTHAGAWPSLSDDAVLARAALGSALPASGAHPQGRPGSYRVPRRLRRLIELRAPRCEFPGCGARAVRCRARPGVAARADVRVQPRPVLPPAPPGQAGGLAQDPHLRRRPLDHRHRPGLAQPPAAPAAAAADEEPPADRDEREPVGRAQPGRPRRAALDPRRPPGRPGRLRAARAGPRARRRRPHPAADPARRHPLDPRPQRPLRLGASRHLTVATR